MKTLFKFLNCILGDVYGQKKNEISIDGLETFFFGVKLNDFIHLARHLEQFVNDSQAIKINI